MSPAAEIALMHALYRLVALLAFVAALFGCGGHDRSIVHRVTQNGVDLLDSRVEIDADRARFDCRASQSGHCRYTVFARACAARDRCDESPLRQLSVPTGTHRDLTGLPAGMAVCARTDDTPVDARCRPLASSG